jgi:hypothetical protein
MFILVQIKKKTAFAFAKAVLVGVEGFEPSE